MFHNLSQMCTKITDTLFWHYASANVYFSFWVGANKPTKPSRFYKKKSENDHFNLFSK